MNRDGLQQLVICGTHYEQFVGRPDDENVVVEPDVSGKFLCTCQLPNKLACEFQTSVLSFEQLESVTGGHRHHRVVGGIVLHTHQEIRTER